MSLQVAPHTLTVSGQDYQYYSLPHAASSLSADLDRLPKTIKILLENLLRFSEPQADIMALAKWKPQSERLEIAWRPTRVLMQDFTGVPAIVDLAAMRDAVASRGADPSVINPQIPVDLVIDHSVTVERFGDDQAFADNVAIEMERNRERYRFLHWGQQAFENFRVVPPGTGICHQVNLEYLASVVHNQQVDGSTMLFPDTLVGTDSHTTMINGLAVLGWGVGGIEAEAAMLGQPISMLIPDVIGFHLHGVLGEGITATDLVLTVTQMLRQKGVVGKFVEFFGEGLDELPLADRATIANMAPEYGATCGFFPVDQLTLNYLKLSGRSEQQVAVVEAYCKAQGLWRDSSVADPEFTDVLDLDLATVQSSLAGPKRPQDRVAMVDVGRVFGEVMVADQPDVDQDARADVAGAEYSLTHGDVVIAAITSCTNTSNPAVMLCAGLLAKKANELGLKTKPWVKTSLAPGSKVVSDYLNKSGVQTHLDALGFNLVGYGCTTCIGNSGPLPEPIGAAIEQGDLNVCSVLSGNRNFEGRIHPLTKSNWLASPPLVVAYALAGTMRIDLSREPLGEDASGNPVYLKDIWPSTTEVAAAVSLVSGDMFQTQYADVFSGDEQWQNMDVADSQLYPWDEDSTYIRLPTFFTLPNNQDDIESASILAKLGNSITTDHISPAGAIAANSPAADYLRSHGVEAKDFNSYGSRRGNHEVMMRGTFANIRIRNEMVPDVVGGYTRDLLDDEIKPIFTAAMDYQQQGIPLVVVAGKEYGTGSSRDWAAKGTLLQGVRAVIAESFERIHRSNLLGMGVLPLQFAAGQNRDSLGLTGKEKITIRGLGEQLSAKCSLTMEIVYDDGRQGRAELLCRLDTEEELKAYRSGGILRYVLNQLVAE
ncbi:aconitate hydratase AcnA [uncultured Desulfuromonas sp.]|uniref:aconitate hydratase AcnA n=1 Tax=uncultured Desulfuromonas sp. TaxID=181013 RepID=UPI002AAC3B95|nr:aconitate hydratase AcnA [uncultured Desulfuromonas sp.]